MRPYYGCLTLAAAFLITAPILAAESTPAELRQLGPEIQRLARAWPLKERVAVTVVSPRVFGVACETPERRIVIVDHGLAENLRTLRHEWNHLWRLDRGDPDWRDDPPSVKAEMEWAPKGEGSGHADDTPRADAVGSAVPASQRRD